MFESVCSKAVGNCMIQSVCFKLKVFISKCMLQSTCCIVTVAKGMLKSACWRLLIASCMFQDTCFKVHVVRFMCLSWKVSLIKDSIYFFGMLIFLMKVNF